MYHIPGGPNRTVRPTSDLALWAEREAKSASMVEEVERRSRTLPSPPTSSRLQVIARLVGIGGLLAAAGLIAYWLVESSINFAGSPDAPPDALTRRAMP